MEPPLDIFTDLLNAPRLARDLVWLVLLGASNTLPIAARVLFRDRFNTPVDLGAVFFDQRPVFGPHKTWRGIIASISGTGILSWFIGIGLETGLLLSAFSMAGDLVASFIKRRMNLKSGARATGLDQSIEAFLPLALMRQRLGLAWADCFGITVAFMLLEILLSPVFYRLGFRRRPY